MVCFIKTNIDKNLICFKIAKMRKLAVVQWCSAVVYEQIL